MRRAAVAVALAALSVLVATTARSQGVRGEIRATAALVEYRSVERDSLPESAVPGTGIVRALPDGTIVTCIPGQHCYWYRGGTVQRAHPLTQDVDLAAWPGLRGVSARVHLRGRYGSNDLWPRSRQEFAALAAWLDFERNAFRIRGGRQEHRSGLGTEVFDGAAFLWRGFARWRFEAFVGRSLVDALLQPRTGFLLHDADDLAPDESSALWGLEARLLLGPRFATTMTYQRNLRLDRIGLYSERVALDALGRVGTAAVETSVDYDFATGDFDEARVRLQTPVRQSVHVAAEARHREPFFELWTIWGAFAPVGFDEGRLESWWTPSSTLRFDAGGSYRNYRETHTGLQTMPIEGDGWRAQAGVDWAPKPWRAAAIYRLHWGHGAYRSSIDGSAQRTLGDAAFVGVFGSATQQFAEFRFGDGRTQGGGVDFGVESRSMRVNGSVAWYWHAFEARPGFQDYGQWRAALGVTYRVAAGANADGVRVRPTPSRPVAWATPPSAEERAHE